MAIFWLNPHSATNGVGTYADPLNGTQVLDSNSSIVTGDEIRIMSKSVVAMTSSTFLADYTFSNTNNIGNRLTGISDTSGIAAYDLIMDDVTKMVGMVTIIGADYIEFYSQTGVPIIGETNIVQRMFRVISDKSHRMQHSGSVNLGFNKIGISNINITDGWENETTRHTDKSFMTIWSSNTGTSISLTIYLGAHDTDTNANQNVSLENTAVCPGGASSSSNIDFNVYYMRNSTFNFHSYIGGNSSGRITIAYVKNSTMNLYCLCSYYGGLGNNSLRVTDTDIVIDKIADGGGGTYMGFQNCTGTNSITLKSGSAKNSTLLYQIYPLSGQMNVIFDGPIYYFNPLAQIAGGAIACLNNGSTTTYTNNFAYYDSEGDSIDFQYKIAYTTQGNYTNVDFTGFDDSLINNSSTTIPSNFVFAAASGSAVGGIVGAKMPLPTHTATVLYKSSIGTGGSEGLTGFYGGSKLFIDKDGADTFEYLYDPTINNYTYATKVVKEGLVFKTTAPSYKFERASFHETYDNPRQKIIQVPVTGDGVKIYTISGWIKGTAAQLGLLEAHVYHDFDIDIYSMTGTDISDWVEFSVSFTPATVQVAELRIVHQWASNGAFYLSDVTVTST